MLVPYFSYFYYACFSTEHELSIGQKCTLVNTCVHLINRFLTIKLSDFVLIFILLINVKMPTDVGILTLMSR